MSDQAKHAMEMVLHDMGRAAREGRARRFQKRPAKGVDVKMGDLEMQPNEPKGVDVTIGDVTMEPNESEMDELSKEFELQR